MWTCETRKDTASKIQWWDRHRIMAIDIAITKKRKLKLEGSHWTWGILKSSKARSIRFQSREESVGQDGPVAPPLGPTLPCHPTENSTPHHFLTSPLPSFHPSFLPPFLPSFFFCNTCSHPIYIYLFIVSLPPPPTTTLRTQAHWRQALPFAAVAVVHSWKSRFRLMVVGLR